jgi:uncharacterized protein (TIGR03437 family)
MTPLMRAILFIWVSMLAHEARASLPSRTNLFAPLPAGAFVSAIQVDGSGNVVAAGGIRRSQTASDYHVFVAKFTASGAKVYFTVLSGTGSESASALALDSSGAAYITGVSTSPDFPTTKGALQMDLQATYQAFIAKLNAAGEVQYATFLGGSSNTSGFDIALGSAGEALVTGQSVQGVFPTTPDAVVASTDTNTYFAAKIDSAGAKLLVAVRGLGGGKIAADSQGNIYLAGEEYGGPAIPTTAGAFQAKHDLQGCGGTGFVGIACTYQYVAKLNSGGTQLIFATYVTGSFGAAVASMAVDGQGNILLAGTTNSRDYPTTPGAMIEQYIATALPPPQPLTPHAAIIPPPAAGYLTKVNSTGTGLIFSTYFSGSQTDTIDQMQVAGNYIYLHGSARSPDLPGLTGTPAQCVQQSYVTRVTADGNAVTHTQLTGKDGGAMAVDSQGVVYEAGISISAVDFTARAGLIACILDAADFHILTSLAPGELVSIFGNDFATFGPSTPAKPGSLPTLIAGTSIMVNGIPAPLLYVSPQQVNAQIPFEISGATTANIQIAIGMPNVTATDALNLTVAARQPSVFLRSSPEYFCNGLAVVFGGGHSPVALNADGSQNTCANAAPVGSTVTLFFNGVGVTSPPSLTGVIAQPPAVALGLPISFAAGSDQPQVVSTSQVFGAVQGLWQVTVKVPSQANAMVLTPLIDGVQVSDAQLVIWVKR